MGLLYSNNIPGVIAIYSNQYTVASFSDRHDREKICGYTLAFDIKSELVNSYVDITIFFDHCKCIMHTAYMYANSWLNVRPKPMLTGVFYERENVFHLNKR